MKSIFFFLFLCPFLLFAQQQKNVFAKIGIGYAIGTKHKQAFEVNIGAYYHASNYIYLGPKFNLTKIQGTNLLINIGSDVGLNAIRLTEKAFNEPRGNIDAQVGVYFGFNLDKHNNQQKRFLLSKSTVYVGLSSTKFLNNHPYIGYNLNEYYNLDEVKRLNSIEVGSFFNLF